MEWEKNIHLYCGRVWKKEKCPTIRTNLNQRTEKTHSLSLSSQTIWSESRQKRKCWPSNRCYKLFMWRRRPAFEVHVCCLYNSSYMITVSCYCRTRKLKLNKSYKNCKARFYLILMYSSSQDFE